MADGDNLETCVHCGARGCRDIGLIQVGTEQTGRYWVHDKCWQPWYMARKAAGNRLSDRDVGMVQGALAARETKNRT